MGKGGWVRDSGSSWNIGDQNGTVRSVVWPFVRSTYAKRTRNWGCSSPNGGTPLNAPKKSASIVARGANVPSTGGALKVKLMRVLRTSPSKMPCRTPGWSAGAAAHSAFWPCPKPPNSPRSRNTVALTKPLMVRVSPSPSFTTCPAGACCAGRGSVPATTRTRATANPENNAFRLVMTSPRVKAIGWRRALTSWLPPVAGGIRWLGQPHRWSVDDAIGRVGHLELAHDVRHRPRGDRRASAGGPATARREHENAGTQDDR